MSPTSTRPAARPARVYRIPPPAGKRTRGSGPRLSENDQLKRTFEMVPGMARHTNS